MASGLVLRFLAFIAFVGLMGGSVYGAYQTLQPDELSLRGIRVETPETALSAAPGGTFALAVAVENRGESAEDVRLSVRAPDGFTVGDAAAVSAPAKNGSGAFVAVGVPTDASGVVTLTVVAETVTEPVKRATRTVTLTVLGDDAKTVTEGDGVLVQYVGRLPSGEMFDTNKPAYAALTLPKAEFFRSSARNATVYTDPAANVIPGFRDGLVGLREGETRQIAIAAEDAYGPDHVQFDEPRRTTVPRTETLPVREVDQSLDELRPLLQAEGQDADALEVGDHFTRTVRDDAYRFRVTSKSADSLGYVLDPALGDRFTIPDHAYWPDAAEVTSVNETAVVLTITPTTETGETFTFHEFWPDASRVTSVTNDTIVVTHAPAEGLEFERALQAGGEPVTHRVVRVEEDHLVLSYESPHPLAGEDIVFDVTVLEILPPRNG